MPPYQKPCALCIPCTNPHITKRIEVLSKLIHVPVENKSFTAADLRLSFCICRLLVFSCNGPYFMSLHNEIAAREGRFDFYGGWAGRKKYLGRVKFYRTYCIIYKRHDRVASEKNMSRPENIFQPSSPPPAPA